MTDTHGPVEPYSLQEVLEFEETYWKWAYFQSRDEDFKQDYQGERSAHIRLIETVKRLYEERKAFMALSASQATHCHETCHTHCCNCVDRLTSVLDKVPADVRTVLETCIEDCRKCCDELSKLHQPLASKRP